MVNFLSSSKKKKVHIVRIKLWHVTKFARILRPWNNFLSSMYVYIFWSTTESTKIFQKTFQTFLLWSQTFDISIFKKCVCLRKKHRSNSKNSAIALWEFKLDSFFSNYFAFGYALTVKNAWKSQKKRIVSEFSTLLFHVMLL